MVDLPGSLQKTGHGIHQSNFSGTKKRASVRRLGHFVPYFLSCCFGGFPNPLTSTSRRHLWIGDDSFQLFWRDPKGTPKMKMEKTEPCFSKMEESLFSRIIFRFHSLWSADSWIPMSRNSSAWFSTSVFFRNGKKKLKKPLLATGFSTGFLPRIYLKCPRNLVKG